ncbi:AraC family transcriptional regulator [Candidatus Enterococcus ferrettii]|uniref:HTH araC/xylS-type domain-containing protein n=1 Tax=Candidatus Enterococcus ferrettii TaxID=2815324 RepID=A0ABV0EV05_9ENTE|nr:AraC family transcriptional regulator [Enterococcus sp. 665A]MBO1342378.1 AraC family transcriptional regulator [Enterococcus sp. 665A]
MYNASMDTNLKEYTDRFTDFSKKSISDFILYNSGIEYCEPGYSYGPKRRDYHFIHFVKEGKGLLEVENRTIEVFENQLFVVPANVVSTYTADNQVPWKYCWIGFTGIESSNFIHTLLQSSKQNYVLDCSDAAFYEKEISKILSLNHNNRSSYFKINGIMYNIVGTLLEEVQPNDSANIHEASAAFQAMRYMDLHYHDDIQISDIAHFIGVHPNYLSLRFKEEMGVTPKKYLTNLKTTKAKKLLMESDDPVSLIASSVGFTDALSFSKFFKKEIGYSPTEFRKEQQTQ